MLHFSSAKVDLYEAIADEVCRLERPALIDRLTHFEGRLPLDFSQEYLNSCTTDQMRHLLAAALWRCRMQPAERA